MQGNHALAEARAARMQVAVNQRQQQTRDGGIWQNSSAVLQQEQRAAVAWFEINVGQQWSRVLQEGAAERSEQPLAVCWTGFAICPRWAGPYWLLAVQAGVFAAAPWLAVYLALDMRSRHGRRGCCLAGGRCLCCLKVSVLCRLWCSLCCRLCCLFGAVGCSSRLLSIRGGISGCSRRCLSLSRRCSWLRNLRGQAGRKAGQQAERGSQRTCGENVAPPLAAQCPQLGWR
jgi:hypothetical protein